MWINKDLHIASGSLLAMQIDIKLLLTIYNISAKGGFHFSKLDPNLE